MKPLYALALTAFAFSVQAATPPASPGTQAIECFAVYKMAGDAPQNAGNKSDIVKSQNLMQWSMEKAGVTQKQFNGTMDAFMGRLNKMEPTGAQKYMGGKIASCNTYAKSQYDAYLKEKSASPSK
ncbi:MAG: hypothetical protein JSR63_08520 [Proteobacteria bacterium]|nr:hypothetical protein [Pseudomonadota bacterium]